MQKLSVKHATAIFGSALFVRVIIMALFIQPNGFYKQADSFDYHSCTLSIATGNGMHHLITKTPIFWRTPGYPLFLATFYRWVGLKGTDFDNNSTAQKAALWFQLFLASLIPIILFYLANTLTHSYSVATMLAWLAIVHPGLVLASTYLLSEGIALIFFYLFLLFLYQLIIPQTPNRRSWLAQVIYAALMLSIYTWMRPMGEFVAYFSALLLAIAGIGTWKQKLKMGGLFLIIFFLSLFPWYYRNYQLTGEYFFCPTIGTYLNCFSVPKLLRRSLNKSILTCHQIAQQNAAREVYKQQVAHPDKHISNNACKAVAYPIIAQHPWYFIYDWIVETIKTTFDLYTYQLVAMFEGSHWYDPIEEHLPEKISACLYAFPMPWAARALCWLEFLYALLLWIGIVGGLWVFIIRLIINRNCMNAYTQQINRLWLTTLPMIGIIVGMTGGFGYARLRLPAEPLLIILSLTFWQWLFIKERKK